MLDLLRKIKKPKYEPLNKIEITKSNLIFNYDYLQSLHPDSEIWPVLKSNAYGHGLKQVCQILNETSCQQVIVDSFPEAQIAYKYFSGRVLLLGEAAPDSYRYCNFRKTEFIVYNPQTISNLAKIGKKTNIHIFVNTGMNREGVSLENLDEVVSIIQQHPNLKVTGLTSHFASADDISDLNQKQIDNFSIFLDRLKEKGIGPKYKHLGNSAGTFLLPGNPFNAFRAGLAFYGYNPFSSEHPYYNQAQNLRPALEVFSKITSIQNTRVGEPVSYNETFQAREDTQITTIPFGYYEGLDRRCSNKTKLQLLSGGNKEIQVAGRVCMNLTSLDVGKEKVSIGDPIRVISKTPGDPNTVQNIAREIDTIPYEILTNLKANIHRKIV